MASKNIALFGDFRRGYTTLRLAGRPMEIERASLAGADTPKDSIRVIVKSYLDGRTQNPDAFKLLRTAA